MDGVAVVVAAAAMASLVLAEVRNGWFRSPSFLFVLIIRKESSFSDHPFLIFFSFVLFHTSSFISPPFRLYTNVSCYLFVLFFSSLLLFIGLLLIVHTLMNTATQPTSFFGLVVMVIMRLNARHLKYLVFVHLTNN